MLGSGAGVQGATDMISLLRYIAGASQARSCPAIALAAQPWHAASERSVPFTLLVIHPGPMHQTLHTTLQLARHRTAR